MNKKVVVGTVLTVLVIVALTGLIVIDHFGSVVKLEAEAIHDEAYSEGYNEGYDKGFFIGNLTGHQMGNSSGHNIGFFEGFSDGNTKGYNSGYDSGVSDGYELGHDKGNETGYSIGYDIGYQLGYTKGADDGVGHGYNIRDPTRQQAKNFIAWDRTEGHEYTDDYICYNFAADFKTNAFEAGYRCGFVYVEFEYWAHAMVCFDPIDYELIYIEPQTDEIVSLRVGGKYWGDTITYIAIVW